MSYGRAPNRGEEYRRRAEEARAKAESMTADSGRLAMLQVAAYWGSSTEWPRRANGIMATGAHHDAVKLAAFIGRSSSLGACQSSGASSV